MHAHWAHWAHTNVVASPELAFTACGRSLPGCGLRVWFDGDVSKLPNPNTDHHFDHVPVGAFLRWVAPGAATKSKKVVVKAPVAVRWQWRDELQEHYLSALEEPEVQALWQGIGEHGNDSEAAVQAFSQGLEAAVDMLQHKCGRVIVKVGAATPQGRPTNGWYNSECAAARHALRAVEKVHGRGSEPARHARKAYRLVVRRTKLEFEEQRQQQLLDRLYSDPKAFWDTYKDRAPTKLPVGVDVWTEKFHTLFGDSKSADYLGGSVETHCARFAELFPAEASAEARASAADLNTPFSAAEVQSALGLLKDHKSAHGMPAEFLSKAWVPVEVDGKLERFFVLGPWMVQLFNSVLFGDYPASWHTSALVPVPKPKGNPDDTDDYRGIAVGAVLAKVYSLCMHARMDAWAEEGGFRARGQAGFRAGRGTADNCFVLRHMIDAAACRREPLYCAFIDFSKAYDRVDRALLWRVLAGFGLHGPALSALQNMYAHVQLQVRAGCVLGAPFDSLVLA